MGVGKYLESLTRVQSQYAQLSQTPMRMNQDSARELGQLLDYGTRQLLDVFDSLVKEDNKPIEPLSYTTKSMQHPPRAEPTDKGLDTPFPRMASTKLGQMKDISSFVAKQQSRAVSSIPTIQKYSEARGNYLAASLQNMATASISTARSMKADEMYRAGQNTIADYAQAIEGIFVAEWLNVTSVFGRDECSVTFEQATARALDDFSKTLITINNMISNNIESHCFLGYEIIDIANRMAVRMDSSTGQLKQQIIDAAKPVRNTAKSSLTELLEDIKRRISSMISLPQDGAAIGFTTEVMKRIQALNDYRAPLASIMTSVGDGGWSNGGKPSRTFDVSPDKDALLAHYITDTLDALFSNLEEKARTIYRSKPLLGIFVANNVAVADRMLRNSDIRLNLGSPSKLESWAKRGTAAYLESWREPCAALMDVQYTNRGPRPQSGTAVDSASIVKALSSKDRDAIKEKFKTFNMLYDSLSSKHKEMSRNMERDVKAQVTREISALIEPLYGRFYDRYHDIDRGKGKYVKYDKALLAAQIAALG